VEGGFYFRNPHNRGGVNDGGTNDSGEQLLLVADLTPDLSGNCPTDIAVGSNVLDNHVYINQVADNPDCFAFNELFPGGFTPKFGGIVTDALMVVGTRGELDNELNYDVSGAYGTNEIDYAISNTINPSLGPETPTSFNPGRYIQTEASFNIDINKYNDIGGNEPLFLAGGIEYRYEAFDAIAGDPKSYEVGPLAAQGFGIGSNGFPGLAARFQGKDSRNSAALYIDSEYFFSDDFMVGQLFGTRTLVK
jgi:iron complex outermembrane receptor protein